MKKIYLPLLLFTLLLSSCQIEEPVLPEEQKDTALKTVSIETALSELSNSSSKSFTKQGEEVYVVPKPEEFYYAEILNSEEKLLVIPADHKNSGVRSRMFILEVNSEIQIKVFNMYPEQPQTTPHFSGEIGIFDTEGTFLKGFRVKNGQMISYFIKSKSTNKMVSDGVCQEHGNCYKTSICIHCEQSLDEVLIDAPAPSQPRTIDVPTLYPDYEPNGNEDPSIDYGMGPGEGSSASSTTTPTEEEDKILNELEGKADCTYQKLSNTNLLKKTLQRFTGENTPVHLILKQQSNLKNGNGDLLNGQTVYGDSYYITIILNSEQANNRPSLDVARTILHEAIHAEIFRKIKTTSTDISRLIIDKNSWPTLFDYYNNYPENPQHNYMADYYRTAMVEGLKEYASLNGLTYPEQFYKDLAWAGLRGTEAWNKMFKDPVYNKQEQDRILKTLIDFSNSGSNECE